MDKELIELLRQGELIRLVVVNCEDYSITLMPMPKRSNRTVFLNEECQSCLA